MTTPRIDLDRLLAALDDPEGEDIEQLCRDAGVPDPIDTTGMPTNSERYMRARHSNAQREAAIEVLEDESIPVPERIEAAKRAMSQLVTPFSRALAVARGEAPPTTPRNLFGRNAPSDAYRQHLRAQLRLEVRRYMGSDLAPYQPWVENIELLYEYAGMPETPLTELGGMWKFCRVDLSKPFEPGNVQWMTHDQMMTRMHTRVVEYEGEQVTLPELAKRTGLKLSTLRSRYDNGVRGPMLWVGRNLGSRLTVTINGEEVPLAHAARVWGISTNLLRSRIARGMTGAALMTRQDLRRRQTKRKMREEQ